VWTKEEKEKSEKTKKWKERNSEGILGKSRRKWVKKD